MHFYLEKEAKSTWLTPKIDKEIHTTVAKKQIFCKCTKMISITAYALEDKLAKEMPSNFWWEVEFKRSCIHTKNHNL